MKRFKDGFFLLLIVNSLTTWCLAEEIILSVNLRKPIAVTDEKFLSLTIDPVTLLAGNALSTNFERSINLAKALTPAYVRFGGPQSCFNGFARENPADSQSLSEPDWILSHQWAQKAGLDVIACISPDNQEKFEQSEEVTEIISFSDHMDLNANWQLGYECQSRCNLSASDLAKQTVDLRRVLNRFPKYSKSIISGPDVVAYDSEEERKYLRDYFSKASAALSAITWHPDFAGVTLDNGGAFINQDNLERDKEALFKVIGRFVENRPLWIAESKPEECKHLFIGALILVRRLGNAAKSNVNVVLRQPTDLSRPTPDYWVSLLHKTLVGPEVFDVKVQMNKRDHVYLYCQCTKASHRYGKGSIMMFGVNLNPEEATISLKGSQLFTVHKYVLSPGFDAPNRMFARTVLLNNRTLTLINDTIPEIEPEIVNDPKGLDLYLQPGGIAFWVIPNLKAKSCMGNVEESKGESLLGSGVAQNLLKAEDLKIHVTRSVRDRSKRNEARKQRTLPRNSSVRRELERLKKFIRKKLDDYESRSLLNVRGLSDSNEETNKMLLQLQEDPQRQLQEYRVRFRRFINLMRLGEAKTELSKSYNDLVEDITSLMSKIQTALEVAQKETDFNNRIQSLTSIKEYLEALYDLLVNMNLNDSSNLEEIDEKSQRSKRNLFAEFASPTFNREKLRKRSKIDYFGGSRTDRNVKLEDGIGEEIQPSVLGLQSSESGENNFYGFLKTEPAADFPEGDVFFGSEDSSVNTDYDESKDRRIDRNQKSPAKIDRPWMEDENDYPFYEHVEFIGDSKPINRMEKNSDNFGEFWPAETYATGKNNKGFPNDSEDFEIVRTELGQKDQKTRANTNIWGGLDGFPKNHRRTYGELKLGSEGFENFESKILPAARINYKDGLVSNYGSNSALEGLDFSTASEFEGNRRSRREIGDLHSIFDQEMIDEDDANSKDCNCRVIRHSETCNCRSKRDAIESLESLSDTEMLPKTQSHVVDLSKDIAHGQLREDPDVEIFATLRDSSMEKSQSPSKSSTAKIANARHSKKSSLQIESSSPDLREISSLESRLDSVRVAKASPKRSELVSKNLPSAPEDENLEQFSKTATRDVQRKLFRVGEERKGKKKAAINIRGHSSGDQEDSGAILAEKIAEKKSEAEEIAAEAAESSSTTFKTATLSEEAVRNESEPDHNNNYSAGENSKRASADDVLSREKATQIETATISAKDPRGKEQAKTSKSKANSARPRESKASKRAKALRALRDLFRELKQSGTMVSTPKAKWVGKVADHQKNREEQVQKLTKKLREKRQMMLEQYEKDVRETVDEEKDEEKRNIKRRDTWEAIKAREDYRELMDREKLAYILMYQPNTYDNEEESSESEETVEKIQVPVTELVRAQNIRQRIFSPKSQHSFYDRSVMEHPNPDRLRKKMIELANLNRARENYADGKGNDKSYYALVEDVNKPRFFYYQKPKGEQKKRLQASLPRSLFHDTENAYNRLAGKSYRQSLKAAQYSSEEDEEESDELPQGKEIYIIDPSEYKGGDPSLRSYKEPSKSFRSNIKILPKDTYEIVWQPRSYKSYTTRQTEQREPAISKDSHELPRNTGQLLKILMDNLDEKTAVELFRRLTGHNLLRGDEKHNFMRSIVEEEAKEEEEEEEIEEVMQEGSKEEDVAEEEVGEESKEDYAADEESREEESFELVNDGEEEEDEEEETEISKCTENCDANEDSEEMYANRQQRQSDMQQTAGNMQQRDNDMQQRESGIQQKESDMQQREINMQPSEIDMQQRESDMQQKESGMQQRESDMQQKESGMQQRESDMQQAGSNMQQKESDVQRRENYMQPRETYVQQTESDTQQIGNSMQQTRSTMQQKENYMQERESDMQPRQSNVQQRGGNVQQKESYVQPRQSNVQQRESNVQQRESAYMQPRQSDMQQIESYVQPRENYMQKGGSNMQRRESYQAPMVELQMSLEEDSIPQVVVAKETNNPQQTNDNLQADSREAVVKHARNRRSIGDESEEEYFKWLPSFLIRKQPRAIRKASKSNSDRYLLLKEESSEENSDEIGSKLLRILKGNQGYYKAIPIKKSSYRGSEDLEDAIIAPKRNIHSDREARKYRKFPETVKIVIASTSSEESLQTDPILDVKDSNRKIPKDDRDASAESLEKGLELEKSLGNSSDYKDGNVSIAREFYNAEKKEEREEEANPKEAVLPNKPEVLMVLPWAKRSSRFRREAGDQEEIRENRNLEKAEESELQHLDGSSNPDISTFTRIDDVEKSLIQKIPLEKFTAKENINRKKNTRKKKKKDQEGLSSLVEKSIPKLGDAVVDGLKKAENFTGSVEKLLENLDENYNRTTRGDGEKDPDDVEPIGPAQNVLHNAVVNVKKFFLLLGGMAHLFRG